MSEKENKSNLADKENKLLKTDKPESTELKENKTPEATSLDTSDDNEQISLISKEQKALKVSKKAAMMSQLVKTAMETDKDAKEVTLFHIETPIVQKVIEYMEYHLKIPPRKIEKPLKSNVVKDLVDDWDAKFVDVDQEIMFKLLLAANYMDVKSLLMLMCAKVASLMKGKTPDQIRKTFNIRNDYSPEEEEEVRKEHKDLIE